VVVAVVLLRPALGVAQSEIPLLTEIARQGLERNARLLATYHYVVQSVHGIKENVKAVRSAVQVVRNVETLIKHPEMFYRLVTMGWDRAFPEARQVLQDINEIKLTLRAADEPETYDPYAFGALLYHMRQSSDAAYEMLIRAVDHFNVHGNHDVLLGVMRQQQEEAGKILNQTLFGVTPQQAALLESRASAITASAANMTAAQLSKLRANVEVRTIEALGSTTRARTMTQQQLDNLRLYPTEWALQPEVRW
jgi:hypothetical protein